MGLLRKIQVLVGALAHKPFGPRREKADRAAEDSPPGRRAEKPGGASPEPTSLDDERVADLIAREQRHENG